MQNVHAGAGTALVLERPARPGLRGALTDLLRIGAGTRVLAQLTITLFVPLPPVATLATHSAITALTWNSAGYCSSQLLRHPLTRRRLATLVGALEQARLPLAAVQPLAGQLGPALFRIVQARRRQTACASPPPRSCTC
ncbi:hydrogenase [Micractinium conductrix]|uniref:Hydrogenase n=1 Tax=Micractinium conductrix TaxID=554055 RepID=A0A2P6V9A8_9CHLO|nr:hydrogenase [Micractinium conductrix]|eukprot:PSC70677.1 hydrogenase [Micractinium conductrix]